MAIFEPLHGKPVTAPLESKKPIFDSIIETDFVVGRLHGEVRRNGKGRHERVPREKIPREKMPWEF